MRGKQVFYMFLLLMNIVFGHISVEAQRIVFDRGKSNTQSIIITNNDGFEPYLAQIWIEDENKKRIDFPIVALPFLQRIEARRSHQVRISSIGDESELAKDRETLFYFNVLGIPPKGQVQSAAGIQLYVQYKIKLFYRPVGLQEYKKDNGWIEDAIITRYKKHIVIDNKSPYYLSLSGYFNGEMKKEPLSPNKAELMIRPYSQEKMDIAVGPSFMIMYTTDIGRLSQRQYICPQIGMACKIKESIKN